MCSTWRPRPARACLRAHRSGPRLRAPNASWPLPRQSGCSQALAHQLRGRLRHAAAGISSSFSEDYLGAPRPEDASAGYGHGKRAAEYLCSVAAAETDLEAKIARCFAFVGPLLPLDANFAIGNFIRDALVSATASRCLGDGTARRSYLYAADLAVWLWTILIKGESGRPYNVGSEADLSISDLAHLVAGVVATRHSRPGRLAQSTEAVLPARYVPSTARATRELQVESRVALDVAVYGPQSWYSAGP